MGTNYLKRCYLDDAKLAQRARLEFFRALGTRRMVAFVGSMATRAFGYGSWDQLRMQFAGIAYDQAKGEGDKQDHIVDFYTMMSNKEIDGQVGLSMIEEALDTCNPIGDGSWQIKHRDWPHFQARTANDQIRVKLAQTFLAPHNNWRIDRADVGVSPDEFEAKYNVPRALWMTLGIRRFVTTNYDFELERVAMLGNADEFTQSNDPTSARTSPFQQLLDLRNNRKENFSWDLGSGRIRRIFSDGWAIESDLLNRERIDRLVEFAVGTDDVDGHIMHLHGRACTPPSMIVTQRDYDNLYRRDDFNRRPFEFVKRMMMGGNPMVFVGLGMSEAELNRELQEFISNNPYQRVAPTFVLWSARAGGMNDTQMRAKRLDFLRRLGVLIIYDKDILPADGIADKRASADPTPNLKKLGQTFDGDGKDHKTREELLNDCIASDPSNSAHAKTLLRICQDQNASHPNVKTALQQYNYLTWNCADFNAKTDLAYLTECVTAFGRKRDGESNELSDAYIDPTVRERHMATHWRSMHPLVAHSMASKNEPTILWKIESPPKNDSADSANSSSKSKSNEFLRVFREKARHQDFVCITGSQGCGKGFAAQQLAQSGHNIFGTGPANRTLVINGCFCFDTDSLLDFVKRFLDQHLNGNAGDLNEEPDECRFTFMKRMNLAKKARWSESEVLIIVNGCERFFDLSGRPLSAELDQMFHLFRKDNPNERRNARVKWVIFGTDRVRDYMEKLGAKMLEFDDAFPASKAARRGDDKKIPSFYLDKLVRPLLDNNTLPPLIQAAVDSYNANSTSRISSDGMILRQAVFASIFDDASLHKILNGNDANSSPPDKREIECAREIMRALAFVGQPIEWPVLRSMPKLLTVDEHVTGKTLLKLINYELVLECRGFTEGAVVDRGKEADRREKEKAKAKPKWDIVFAQKRFLLHRAILTELRHRFGIPLSEAKLSTAFNMSLYVAQPIDGNIPDCDMHDDLGDAVDALVGAYRHKNAKGAFSRKTKAIKGEVKTADFCRHLMQVAWHCGSSNQGPSPLPDQPKTKQINGHIHANLSFYNEIAALCSRKQVQALRAALAIVRSYYSTTGLLTLDSGDRVLRDGRDGVLLEHAERLDNVIDGYGKCAMAREKLRTLIGKATFDRVFGVAEPFYPDELVWLHNERGVVRLAMGDLYEAKRSFDLAMAINRKWVEAHDRSHNWRRIRLNQIIADVEMGDLVLAERKCEEIRQLCAAMKASDRLREDQLALALTQGILGWIEHLRGRSEPAMALYTEGCTALSQLGEVRAQSFFERLRANCLGSDRPKERRAALELALDLAESSVQMDLVHRLRIDLADTILFARGAIAAEEHQRATRYLEEAMTYSLHAEVHRVRLEAATCIGRSRLLVSDFEGALRFTMDATMIAARYGMELRKITLRATLAKIMAARGHPVTAEQLARTCIKMATRLRFQTAIDKASQVIIDIPRISSAIVKSDESGRRNF